MLKRLHVENFKSLKNVDLEFETNNILVGPNMSVKSNLLDCLKFLTHVTINGVNDAFLRRGGFTEVAWKGANGGPVSFRLVIDIGADDDDSKKSYEYEISIIGSQSGLISIEKENLIIKTRSKINTLVNLMNGRGKVTHADGTVAFTPEDPNKSALEYSVPGWEGMTVKKYISAFRYYHLEPSSMKQPNAAVAQTFLAENGNNFSSWYMTLWSSPVFTDTKLS